ncbi:MAG: hypothetical protein RLZZ360_190 [Candidatus Parcubacteria bacterium]|jgi:hypothetical protein
MLRLLAVLLICSLALYWYAAVGMVCPAPLTYQINQQIDERFGITATELEEATEKAIGIWETASGRELFTLATSKDVEVTINLVFDDRQAALLAEETIRESLTHKEMSSVQLQETYDSLVAEYQTAKQTHEAHVAAYEDRLAAHNALVATYNEAGGVPEAEYAALQKAESALAREADTLESETERLNNLAREINSVGERGNQIIRQYNEGVTTYNERFGAAEEFTEGDYQNGQINIYTFKNKDELVKVLAHEFGHALSIPHVEGSESVMYYLLEDQPTPLTLSAEDTAALVTVCGNTGSVGTQVRTLINRYII